MKVGELPHKRYKRIYHYKTTTASEYRPVLQRNHPHEYMVTKSWRFFHKQNIQIFSPTLSICTWILRLSRLKRVVCDFMCTLRAKLTANTSHYTSPVRSDSLQKLLNCNIPHFYSAVLDLATAKTTTYTTFYLYLSRFSVLPQPTSPESSVTIPHNNVPFTVSLQLWVTKLQYKFPFNTVNFGVPECRARSE
jgi:hypothetical protein